MAKWKIRLSAPSRAAGGAGHVSSVPELGLLLESKPRFSADTFSIGCPGALSAYGAGAGKTLPRRGCPLVLVLTTFQWSDAASLHTLKYPL